MTDVLEPTARPPASPVAAMLRAGAANGRARRPAFDPSRAALALLATLSAAAGVIHLVMAPSHWGTSTVEGVGFVAAGWFQLAIAWLILSRPARGLLRLTIVANGALIGVWAWSRVFGLPFGAHANHAETVGFVDATAVGLEAALVVGALVVLFHPAIGRGWSRRTLAFGAIMLLSIVVLATAAIASPGARDHAAGSHGDHATGGGEHAAGSNHASTASGAGAGHGAHGAAAPVDDRGLALLSNGHHDEIGPETPLDPATRAELTRQIKLTQQAAEMYPTVADAEAAGYRKAGPYAPGLGLHLIRASGPGLNADGIMDDEDLLSPMSIIYGGTEPDAPVAGFMYYSTSAEHPEGFAGPNDVWHYHTNTCVVFNEEGTIDAPFGADTGDVPTSLCESVGGTMLEQTQWMVHVWSVPGWESQQGLFGEVNPALACPDGTYYQLPMEQWIDHPDNICRSAA